MNFETIGTVKTVTSTFEWLVPSLQRRCLQLGGIWIWSPEFQKGDLRWALSLNFNTSEEWIKIYVYRRDGGVPKDITCTIKVKDRPDVAEISWTTDRKHFGERKFLKKEIALNSIFQHSFTIICSITCDTPHPAAEVEGVSSSSSDTSGDLFVNTSIGPKTSPGKEFVSCASQTEVANSVSEKENPEDEDRSSLDRKAVELLSERMKELLIKGIEQDVTICVQDKEFRAHRSILSARSPVFAMMLSHDTKENNTGVINIEDCDPESFDEFLLYVYSGKTENLTHSNALQLYYTADKYDFPVLKELCVSLLKTSLSVDSICDVILLAAKHLEKELLEVATEFFARNMKKILVTVGWQNFLLQNPLEANELYIKTMEILHPEN